MIVTGRRPWGSIASHRAKALCGSPPFAQLPLEALREIAPRGSRLATEQFAFWHKLGILDADEFEACVRHISTMAVDDRPSDQQDGRGADQTVGQAERPDA